MTGLFLNEMLWLLCLGFFFGPCLAHSENFGIISNIVNKTIISEVSKLKNVHFDNLTIETKEQEFGWFNLDLFNVSFIGLDTLHADIIDISLLPLQVKNLTMYIDCLEMISTDYYLDGMIKFPIGNKNLPLSGENGEFSLAFYDFRLSLSVTFANTPTLHIDDIVLEVNTTRMPFHLVNLLGGGEAGLSFNTVLNDCVIVAFDYYKDALVVALNEPLKRIVGCILCSIFDSFCTDENGSCK